ncbi:MAG: lipoyl-dependent peroxiredoxin [Solirubrobacteraceae bacterium]|nr:lipoyl-dependent peroxiredoxin [Solirubrobacteraceae bacterium]
MPERKANARWEGNLKDGRGTMGFGSGAFEGRYSYRSRFEEGEGTNPEELIAAAHAGCYSMALSADLAEAGHTPESVETEATVSLGSNGISGVHLVARARVPGIEEAEFQSVAEAAKAGCPVSKALAAVEITLDATLEG